MSPLLRFWFGVDDLRATPPKEAVSNWFNGGAAFDDALRERFATLVDSLPAPATDAASALHNLLVLDQLPRNLFRGQARAFATDAAALQTARTAVAQGWDQGVGVCQRLFFYLPFEHSEDLADQAEAVRLCAALADDAPAELSEAAKGWRHYAEVHRDIIQQFGRFPGRNPALGREDTEAERAWLQHGGPTFGQGR